MKRESEVWLEVFLTRATIVIQPQNLVLPTDKCASYADEAVEEYRKRFDLAR